jgi:hypothetical protein
VNHATPKTVRSLAPNAPFHAKCSALDLDVRAVDRGASCHDARVDQRSEQSHRKAPQRPAAKAIVDRRRRTVVCWAVAPPAADLKHMDNAHTVVAKVLSFGRRVCRAFCDTRRAHTVIAFERYAFADQSHSAASLAASSALRKGFTNRGRSGARPSTSA